MISCKMKSVWHACQLWTMCLLMTSNGYPDLSYDYTITEAELEPIYRQYVNKYREINEEFPRICKTNICFEEYLTNARKGDFNWPEVIIGQEVKLRCPFSFDVPVYTLRTCLVDANKGGAIWSESDYTNQCPDPPLAQTLEELNLQFSLLAEDDAVDFFASTVDAVSTVFTLYRDAPVNQTDIALLINLTVESYSIFALSGGVYLTSQTVQDYFNIIDILMEEDLKEDFEEVILRDNIEASIRDLLAEIPLTIDPPQVVSYEFNHVAVLNLNISTNERRSMQVTEGLPLEYSGNSTTKSPQVYIDIEGTGDCTIVSMVILQFADIFITGETWLKCLPEEETRKDSMFLNNFKAYNMTSVICESNEAVYDYEVLGNMILLNTEIYNMDELTDMRVIYKSYTDDTTNLGANPVCVKMAKELDTWSNKDCNTTVPTDEDGFTHCFCTGLGAFGVFRELKPHHGLGPGIIADSSKIIPTIIEGDISSFLGFPYRKELELLGAVLGCLSLACLLITILSYAIFSGTRRGSPTTILLHLCVALVVLSVLLLLVQYVDAIQTTTGCTVANVLRYYMVFVTLMWNAVEAFNMYLMLVKIFNSKVNHFALKAGIIAWGVPLLGVALCFAVNTKSFNGHYVNVHQIQGECTLKCQLSDNMLYYAYLIPLGILILHNLVMFGAVLRTIMKHGQKLGKSKKRSHVVQLVGGVATLVLLGVPWIFSAFGAINATSNKDLALVEGVFQVVFVVFVNLQGMFIFAFHCARNAHVRSSWSSAVRSALSITPSSYMSSTPTKNSSSKDDRSIMSTTVETSPSDNTKNEENESQRAKKDLNLGSDLSSEATNSSSCVKKEFDNILSKDYI